MGGRRALKHGARPLAFPLGKDEQRVFQTVDTHCLALRDEQTQMQAFAVTETGASPYAR